MDENNSQSQVPHQAVGGGSSIKIGIIIIAVAAVVATGVYVYLNNTPNEPEAPLALGEGGGTEVTFEAPQYPDVVAVVNGQEISGTDMRIGVTQVAQAAAAQGLNPSDTTVLTQVEQQALEILINTKLLSEAARTAGVTVSDEAVELEYSKMEGQFVSADEFLAAIAQIGLTPERVKEEIRARQAIDTYLEESAGVGEVTVSDAEVQSAYEAMTEGAEGAPALEEVFEPLKQQLVVEKEQNIVVGVIENLRTSANIEIKL